MSEFISHVVAAAKQKYKGDLCFNGLKNFRREHLPSLLAPPAGENEKKLLHQALKQLQAINAEKERLTQEALSAAPACKVLICMAFTEDYTIGKLCEHVNHHYAVLHEHEFLCEVMRYEDMMRLIAPRQFAGWYKALLLKRLLCEQRQELQARGITHIMWIDADAIYIDHAARLDAFIARAEGRDLVIAEDSTPCCLLNTGVVLARVCDWCAQVWEEVWSSSRHFATLFYEQSALVTVLRRRHQGLEDVVPFHSFAGGPPGVKLFPQVCVLPCVEFNFNRCAGLTLRRQGEYPSLAAMGHDETLVGSENTSAIRQMREDDRLPAAACAQFIFHALGRSSKLLVLLAVVRLRLPHLVAALPACEPLHLVRGGQGKVPSADIVERAKRRES